MTIPSNGLYIKLVGGIPTPLKLISQWEGLSYILWKNKIHVPNHQPEKVVPAGNETCGIFHCYDYQILPEGIQQSP